MHLIDWGCSVLKSGVFTYAMEPMGYFGHAAIGGAVGLALLVYGRLRGNNRMMRIGIAVLLSMTIAGILANFLQDIFLAPRPRGRGYGFPSGHTSTAFGLAASLGVAFPQLSPLFYLFAIFTGISRLYLRAHFVWDILGAVFIGVSTGKIITRRLIDYSGSRKKNFLTYFGWSVNAILSLMVIVFFLSYEESIATHRVLSSEVQGDVKELLVVDFGTPEARRFLGQGWSGDGQWTNEMSGVFATGLKSSLTVPLSSASNDYRLRLHLLPNPHFKCSCQHIIIKFNGSFVGRLDLEYGWENYELRVPHSLVKEGDNEIEFFFAYVEEGKSVSFDTMVILAEN